MIMSEYSGTGNEASLEDVNPEFSREFSKTQHYFAMVSIIAKSRHKSYHLGSNLVSFLAVNDLGIDGLLDIYVIDAL